ncbi:MAG: diphthamide biosynthesis enzyme Dph2 [Thermoprotei archaeon]
MPERNYPSAQQFSRKRQKRSLNDYDFELDKVLSWLKEQGAKRILVEAPEGLKHRISTDILPELNSYTVFLSSKPFHGACETGDDEATALGVDHVIHFGHTQMVARKVPTLYVPVYYIFDPSPSFEELDSLLSEGGKNVALAASVQYLKSLQSIHEHLNEKGFNVIMGIGNRTKQLGQILGCDYAALTSVMGKAKQYLVVTAGDFHVMGAVFALDRPVLQLDPYSLRWRRINPDSVKSWIATESYAWTRLKDSLRVGVILGTEPGQKFLWEAEEAARRLRISGKHVDIISASTVDPNQLSALPYDAFVLAACPRLPYDDAEAFSKPVISVFSVILNKPLGLRDWLRGKDLGIKVLRSSDVF